MPTLPTVLGPAGLIPQTPAALQAALLALVAATRPGYTPNLPGSLIEDISSTDVGALTLIDQARVELVNSLTPFGANAFLLNQLGQVYGVPLGQASNTSVFVQFSVTSSGQPVPGFVIGKGFTISDGSFQYVIQDGGASDSSGNTTQLFALATQAGSWAVPPGTVTQLVTSVPAPFVVTVTNPQSGVPGTGTETETSYRSRVLQAGLAASQGMSRFLKTLLDNVPGVQPRLVSALAQSGGGWEVIVGGGDPYLVAYAIYFALFDISTLVGSTLTVAGITNALPGVVTTFLNHGFNTGQVVHLNSVNPGVYDGQYTIVNVPTEKTFTLGIPYLTNQLTNAVYSAGDITFTTSSPHGVTVGSTIVIAGCTPSGFNGSYIAAGGTIGSTIVVAASDPGSPISIEGQLNAGVALADTSGFGAWISGGVITPNLRNIQVAITDYPDNYNIPFVNPPQQTVDVVITWNTSSLNFVNPVAVAQLGAPAVVDYINSIVVGQPINENSLIDSFQEAIASILPRELLTRCVPAVSINGVGTPVTPGTFIIAGDPESYFLTDVNSILIQQG